MSYIYCAYLSFSDIVAPIGAAAHHVVEGSFLLVYTIRICAFFATVIAVTVGPAVLRGERGWWLGTSTAPTGTVSAAAAVTVVYSMVWSTGEL